MMIAIVDYGMGNLRSVQKAFEHLGARAAIVHRPEEIDHADRVVLPGVGAFGDAMDNLKAAGLIAPIVKAIAEGRPFLGICLGLQLMFAESEEMGLHRGLGILPGRVRRFPNGQRVPQIGWNEVRIRRETALLDGVPDGSYFYFVHSFFVASDRDADCDRHNGLRDRLRVDSRRWSGFWRAISPGEKSGCRVENFEKFCGEGVGCWQSESFRVWT